MENIIKDIERMIKDIGNNNIPIFIELLGTPNSGKTSALKTLEKILKRNNVKHKIVYELADKCKIKNKLSPEFNLWTLNETLNQLLEIAEKKYTIIICERGLLDSICWFYLHLRNKTISNEAFESIVSYLSLNKYSKFRGYSFILKCDVQTSIKRENVDDLLEIKGSIVNSKILTEYNTSLETVKNKYSNLFSEITEIDTSNLNQSDINKKLVYYILNYLSRNMQ